MSIQNLQTFDPFANEGELPEEVGTQQNLIHLRVQQRNGRKMITTLQGLPKEYDQKKMLKFFKKEFACNGSIISDPDLGEVIQLQGDHRKLILDFLLEEKVPKNSIKVHGF